MSNQAKIEEIVETLRTSTATQVFEALKHAPTENLQHMRDMILHILQKR